jgi:hypothetical protein
MRVGVQRLAFAALPRKKKPGINYTADWVGPRAGQGGCIKEKIFSFPTGFKPQTIQPAVCRYIDYVMPAPHQSTYKFHL